MSRIDEMVQRLCPDGVEYRKLGEVGTFTRGSGIQKKDFVEDGRPCIHYGQVYTYYGLSATETKSFISDELYAGRKKAVKGDLVIATTSENEEDVCKCVAWLGDEPCAVSGDAYIFSHDQDPKYVAYLFCSDQFQEQKKRYITGTKVLRVSGDNMARIELPFPPLDIQHEVVRVLDSFAELEAELEAELKAELEARKAQYAHYRDELLSRESLEAMAGCEISTVKVGELLDFKNGISKSREFFGRGVPIVNYVDVYKRNGFNSGSLKGRVDADSYEQARYDVKRGDVFFTRTSETQEEIGIAAAALEDIPGAVFSGFVLRGRPRGGSLLPEYCKYCFSSSSVRDQIIRYSSLTTRALTNGKSLSKVVIPVPPLFVQRQVVDIFDRFESLTTSLTDCLPAEIEARREQYEYYRDKLLDFPRKEVA